MSEPKRGSGAFTRAADYPRRVETLARLAALGLEQGDEDVRAIASELLSWAEAGARRGRFVQLLPPAPVGGDTGGRGETAALRGTLLRQIHREHLSDLGCNAAARRIVQLLRRYHSGEYREYFQRGRYPADALKFALHHLICSGCACGSGGFISAKTIENDLRSGNSIAN